MDEWTIKTTNPICQLFFQLTVNRLYSILCNRFYRLEIHSLMVCIFDPACELVPPWTKELYLCTVAPLLYLLYDLLPLPPSQCTVYTDIVWLWGAGGCWNVLWTIFCRSFTLCFWPHSELTKLLHHPKQKWPVKTTLMVSLRFLLPWLYL